jgi:hypothetical protein
MTYPLQLWIFNFKFDSTIFISYQQHFAKHIDLLNIVFFYTNLQVRTQQSTGPPKASILVAL